MIIPKDSWNGNHYSAHKGFQDHSWVLQLFTESDFSAFPTMLDIGSGNGKITAELAKRNGHGSVLGIDSSQSMVEQARSLYGSVPHLRFEVADVLTFRPEESFDLITSFFVLHWIADQRTFLKNIKSWLKPAGKALMVMKAYQEDDPVRLALRHLEQEERWKDAIGRAEKNIHTRSKKRMEMLLREAGFHHHTVSVIQRGAGSSSLDDTVQALMRSVPHSSGLHQNDARSFCRDIATDIYKQFAKDPEEPFSFLSSFLVIECF